MSERQGVIESGRNITDSQVYELLRPNMFMIYRNLYPRSWVRRIELMRNTGVTGGAFQASINKLIRIGFVVSKKEGEKDCRYNLTVYGKRRYPIVLRAWETLNQITEKIQEPVERPEIQQTTTKNKRKRA